MSPERSRQEGASEPTALIFDVMRFSTHDGPGIRTAVFLKGCPLACEWCHNPEGQSYRPELLFYEERCRHCWDCIGACPNHAIAQAEGVPCVTGQCARCGTCVDACLAEARRMAGRRVTVRELLAEIEKDLVFFDESGGGVTLTGGEPLSQPPFVAALLAACRERGIVTALETCGFAPTATFIKTALLADLVLFDLKLMDPAAHRRRTGVSNARILANFETLAAIRPVRVRIPVTPGINDSDDETRRFADYLAGKAVCSVELLPYHRTGARKYDRLGLPYRLEDTPEPARSDLERFACVLAGAGLPVRIGG